MEDHSALRRVLIEAGAASAGAQAMPEDGLAAVDMNQLRGHLGCDTHLKASILEFISHGNTIAKARIASLMSLIEDSIGAIILDSPAGISLLLNAAFGHNDNVASLQGQLEHFLATKLTGNRQALTSVLAYALARGVTPQEMRSTMVKLLTTSSKYKASSAVELATLVVGEQPSASDLSKALQTLHAEDISSSSVYPLAKIQRIAAANNADPEDLSRNLGYVISTLTRATDQPALAELVDIVLEPDGRARLTASLLADLGTPDRPFLTSILDVTSMGPDGTDKEAKGLVRDIAARTVRMGTIANGGERPTVDTFVGQLAEIDLQSVLDEVSAARKATVSLPGDLPTSDSLALDMDSLFSGPVYNFPSQASGLADEVANRDP